MKKRKSLSLPIPICSLLAVTVSILVLYAANVVGDDRWVSTSGGDAGDCSSPSNPCATVQYALDVPVGPPSEIHLRIAQGTYVESVTIPPNLAVAHLQGGWNDGFTARDANPFLTVLQSSSPSANTVETATVTDLSTTTLEDLLITGGSIGVYIQQGGVEALVRLRDCVVTENRQGLRIWVGGMWAKVLIEITNTLLVNNHGEGGLFVSASYYGRGEMTILNSTIAANSGTDTGGLRISVNGWIHEPAFFDVDVINSIVWGNSSSEGGDDIWNEIVQPDSPGCAYMNVSQSNIGDVVIWERDGDPNCYIEGPQMLSTDPVFADASSDHHLDISSPCVDAGSNAAAAALKTDYEGEERILDGDNDGSAIVDLGADEVAEGPAAWWPADGSSVDVSGNANDGGLSGAMGYGSGLSGPGFRFDGVDDYVSVPHDPSLNVGDGDFSAELWIRTGQSTGCWPALIDKRSSASPEAGFIVYLANGRPGIQMRDVQTWNNFTCSPAFLADGLFHRLVITIDRDSQTGLVFSVDGKRVCEFDPTVMTQSLDNAEELWIGKTHDSLAPCFFRGVIDDVLLWPTTLSTRRMTDSLGGLSAWWPVDLDTRDAIGINHGTAQGVSFVPGRNNAALRLNGIDGFVDVPDNSSIDLGSGDFSIAFWVQTTQSSGCWPAVFDKRDSQAGYSVFLSDGRPGIQLAADPTWENFISEVSVADGAFHSVIVTVDRDSSSGGLIYIDGRSVLSFDPTSVTDSLNNNANLWIGKALAGTPCYLDGALDEMMFFRRVLPEQEVRYLAMATPAVIFLDGFEAGSTSSWSSVVP